MSLNVTAILDQLNIPYITQGKNVSKNHVGIPCCFCNNSGDPDPSNHLGINLETGAWNCWRNPSHKGRDLASLIAYLGHMKKADAQRLIGLTPSLLSGTFLESVTEKLNPRTKDNTTSPRLPANFMRFIGNGDDVNLLEHRASNYLLKRGFPLKTHVELSDRYNLRFCYSGAYKDSIIFPIYESEVLLTWVSRSFYDTGSRYNNLPQEKSIQSVPNTLWNWDNICEKLDDATIKKPVLYLCEGPFDAMKIDYFGAKNIMATCLFGLKLSTRQATLLLRIAKLVEVRVSLDNTKENLVYNFQSTYPNLTFIPHSFPPNYKDPGSMCGLEIRKYF